MKRTISFLLVAGIAVAFLAGCAKAPEQEVTTAKAAIEAAKSAEANRYSSTEFAAAQDSLNAALAEIEKQNSAFPLSRNYEKAKKMLLAVSAAATVAQTNATVMKEKMKVETDSAIALATAAVVVVKDLLKKAPRGKEGKEVLIQISNETAVVESTLTQAAALETANDFLGARDKANAGLEKIMSINEELKNAIAKSKGKRK